MMEGDGRNETHLIDWAGIREYLMMIILRQARGAENFSRTWSSENVENALVVWLLWMTSSPGELSVAERTLYYFRTSN